jgi:NADPH-dependent 2,4-dienoyl-CoA reductase/sulfur reductase-like enzyme
VTEPLACVLNGQELAGVGPGDTVVVVGAGPIGCLHVRLARARGAARVVLIELTAPGWTRPPGWSGRTPRCARRRPIRSTRCSS